MKKWTLLLLSLFSLLQSYVNQNNDVQIWLKERYGQKIREDLTLDIKNEWRWGNNASELYHIYLQGILGYAFSDGVFLGTGYRQIWHRLSDTPWVPVYEPLAEFIFCRTRGWARIDVRNRIYYSILEQVENIWHWRGRVRWLVLEGPCCPYLSNEVFMDFKRGFDQDRLALGMIIPIINHFNGDLYYMIRFLNGIKTVTCQHIFGVGIDLRF